MNLRVMPLVHDQLLDPLTSSPAHYFCASDAHITLEAFSKLKLCETEDSHGITFVAKWHYRFLENLHSAFGLMVQASTIAVYF